MNRRRKSKINIFASWKGFLLLACCCFLASHNLHVQAKEIEATSEWTLLGENDTVAAGLHIRMDMTTGEKWVKTIEEDDDNSQQQQDKTTGMVVAGNGKVEATPPPKDESPNYDYEMMHRTLSNLPSDEQERMGGIPKLPEAVSRKITPDQRLAWEKRMKDIWEARQAELQAFKEDHLADLPQLLKDRIARIREYIEGPAAQLKELDLAKAETDEDTVGDILEVLKDLEYQLTDVDMARDFYTLGGWPLLSSLLADAVHENSHNTTTTLADEDWNKVNLIQAHVAWVIGTAVKNTAEFSPYALEQVEVLHRTEDGNPQTVKTSTLDLVLAQFLASARAIVTTDHPHDDYYDAVMTKVHKTLYAVGALLRGNRQSQTHFCADQGPALLVEILAELADQADQKQGLPRDSLKVVQRLMSLAQDIVMDVTLHASTSDQVDGSIRKAFTSPQWCSTLLRFVSIPRLYETTLTTIQQLAPYCISWQETKEEVARQVQRPPPQVHKAWLPQDLDQDLREERLELLESTLQAIRKTEQN